MAACANETLSRRVAVLAAYYVESLDSVPPYCLMLIKQPEHM